MVPTSSEKQPAIDFEKVSRIYRGGQRLFGKGQKDVTALSGVDLSVKDGEIFGLVGESGSGKTTMARLMVRLEDPNQGRIRLHGEDIGAYRGKRLKAYRRRVQMIFQDPYQSLNPYQSVEGIVGEPLAIHRSQYGQARRDKVLATLSMVGLEPAENFLNRYPHQLSGGQRQRVAIARAMVLDPQVLLADEPTSMLDASIKVQIYKILSDIRSNQGVTIIFITHSLAAAQYLCDRIAVIYRGHIVETGPAATVIADPRHPYTQALIDALPKYGHKWTEKRFNTLRHPGLNDYPVDGCPFFSRCLKAKEDQCRNVPPLGLIEGQHMAACFFA